jgi:hypothetical protein
MFNQICRRYSQRRNRDDLLNVRISDRVDKTVQFRPRTPRDDAFWHLWFRSINADAMSTQNALMVEFCPPNPE